MLMPDDHQPSDYAGMTPSRTIMTANLPVVDPKKVLAPVMIVRGEHDGIASEEDLLDFFGKLPNPDRQFVVLPGAAHALVFGHNRHQLWHIVHAFLTMPPRRDRQ
jgi:pimeloyl-ACP methyl ester carboxylesterase